MSIPYPKELQREMRLVDGVGLLLRPIRPDDAVAEQRFIARLSRQTLYLRMHAAVRELSVEQLIRFTQIDYDREMAFVAVDREAGEIRAIARYSRLPDGERAEFAIIVEDCWQGRGLGSAMMGALESCARERHLSEIFGYVLRGNRAMRRMMVARGYRAHVEELDSSVIRFALPLADGVRPARVA